MWAHLITSPEYKSPKQQNKCVMSNRNIIRQITPSIIFELHNSSQIQYNIIIVIDDGDAGNTCAAEDAAQTVGHDAPSTYAAIIYVIMLTCLMT